MSEESAKTLPPETEEPEGHAALHGRILSGMPLSVAAQKRIVQQFEKRLGRHVRLILRIDKSLIAGVRVELDGRAYDGSLSGQLNGVQKMLTRHDEEEL